MAEIIGGKRIEELVDEGDEVKKPKKTKALIWGPEIAGTWICTRDDKGNNVPLKCFSAPVTR